MDDADLMFLEINGGYVKHQGIFADILFAVSTRVINNIFILTKTNFLISVRPGCRSDIDFTSLKYSIRNNTFINSSTVAISYHLFYYNGYSNVTFINNYLDNISGKTYSHIAAQFGVCQGLMANNTYIRYTVTSNIWEMGRILDDARIDLQLQDTNTSR